MLTLTSDFESDSFVSEMSINGTNQEKKAAENIRRSLDIQGEKLNEITSNNRQLIHVESQLARLRSELEKSEMLRQTLEYELTLLRTQHGKQNAFTNQLQNQFNQANEQMKRLQSELNTINHQKDNQLKEKDKKIKELENQAEIFHDRERRIEALNEQIQKMEKSESLSRQNLAQSILSKERETELKREYEFFRIKLEYSEQALEQERSISNEAKLNVQLLNNRLSDMEIKCEELKENNKNQERKIDELERQCTNEKILRTTLSKIQSELETNCTQTQKLTVDYEKQLKTIRDELSNYRRKFRNNEEKYNQIVNKIFEYLRLTKIIQETTNQSDINLPTVKQLEELKIYIEHLKNSKLEQTNEINRLKKTIERLNKNSLNQKQVEHQTEMTREKLQIELDECQEKMTFLEENFQRSKIECEHLMKENEKKKMLLNLIDFKLKNLIGKNSNNIEHNLHELEKQWKNIHLKINLLDEKLIERDNGTLQLTQKLEEQVLNLKHDLDQRHQTFLTQKNQLLQTNQNQIQNLNIQLQKMETRANEYEQLLKVSNNENKKNIDEINKFNLILKHLISLLIPIRRRYFQLIDTNRFLKDEYSKYNKIKSIIYLDQLMKQKKKSLRIYIISIIASKRFISFKNKSSIKCIHSTNFIYDQSIIYSFNLNFIQSINTEQIFQSLINQLNRFYSPITRGSLIKLIAQGIPKSSSHIKIFDYVHSIMIRLDQSESKIHDKDIECTDLKKRLKTFQTEFESRIDYHKFERICDELQRALDREKQAQELLNEQNNQLKSLTDVLHQTQNEKDFIQEKFHQIAQNDKYSKDKIQQLTKTQQQMDENVKRAEKAIRLVASDKEQIASFCNRINSALNVSEKRGLEYVEQLISQLDALVQLPTNSDDNNKSSPEMVSCQTMANGFVNLLNRLKKLIISNTNDIQSLKEHCQMLTEQFRQLSEQDVSSHIDSTQTVLVQAHPVRVQVNHHPQSAFKPIKPEQD
ncbi:unnamed protein product [Rotaria socialis]|uniref:Uncharacterized protein n=1 Tax=Rotaria socialis TaxID=392032 RepID=A0A818BBP8_9BILA|nr:unnamed protein product [Rotaria socialis]CAF3533589.1 unnamed protein product [Rotaria socialis]